MTQEMSVQKVRLLTPSLQEISEVLQKGLLKNFETAEVNVVDCPDLTQKPYMLAAPGLCGSVCLADVGGVPNLIPVVKRDKLYDLAEVAKQVELPDGFLCGAGAGPHHQIGVNCEMMANFKSTSSEENAANCTHIAKVNALDGSCILERSPSSEFALMANLCCTEGKAGKVLQVKASRRTSEENYMTCIRKTLAGYYKDKPVGLGGTFLIGKGRAKLHIMPTFSSTPLKSDADVASWLNFYEMSAPLVCVGTLISHDPDLDLRVEHFHCFSDHGEGGHYHYDTTPSEVEYCGYFSVAEYMYRIDRPTNAHNIGRD